jgi:hypothetical protein
MKNGILIGSCVLFLCRGISGFPEAGADTPGAISTEAAADQSD